jgi:hypothetical protein
MAYTTTHLLAFPGGSTTLLKGIEKLEEDGGRSARRSVGIEQAAGENDVRCADRRGLRAVHHEYVGRDETTTQRTQ